MYGFGSKKALIEDFASTALTECAVVVINGYLQSINIKQVLLLRFDFRMVHVSHALLKFSRITTLVAKIDAILKCFCSIHCAQRSNVMVKSHLLSSFCHCFY